MQCIHKPRPASILFARPKFGGLWEGYSARSLAVKRSHTSGHCHNIELSARALAWRCSRIGTSVCEALFNVLGTVGGGGQKPRGFILGFGVWCLGIGVWGLSLGFLGVGYGGLGSGIWALDFRLWGLKAVLVVKKVAVWCPPMLGARRTLRT